MLDEIWCDRDSQHSLCLLRLKLKNVEGELALDVAGAGEKNFHRGK